MINNSLVRKNIMGSIVPVSVVLLEHDGVKFIRRKVGEVCELHVQYYPIINYMTSHTCIQPVYLELQ